MANWNKIDIDTFNKVLLENGQKILGPRKKKRQHMENSITDERKEQEHFFQINIYETKRSASGRILGNIDKKVKNSAKADRNAYTKEQAIKAEKNAVHI